MTVKRAYEMDQGEYFRIPVLVGEGAVPPWDDLTVVTGILLRIIPNKPGATALQSVGSLDEPSAGGRVLGCGAVVPMEAADGFYNGEITLTGPGGGWPQVLQFDLTIRPRRAAP